MFLSPEIFWRDLTPGGHRWTESLRFDPHPRDFDVEDLDWPEMRAYVSSRQTEIAEMLDQLGDGNSWAGQLKGSTPYGEVAEVGATILDQGTCVSVALSRNGPADNSPEMMIIVPVTRLDRFEPTKAIDVIGGLTDDAIAEMAGVFHAYKCGSLVFSLNTNCRFMDNGLAFPPAHDLRPALVRAVLRWALRHDGVSLTNLSGGPFGRSPQDCEVHKDGQGAYRFTVRDPWGMQASNAFMRVLGDLGYGIVQHPDFTFDNSTDSQWFASKNAEQLEEVVRLINKGDDDDLERKLEELRDITPAEFHWRRFRPANAIDYFAKEFGNKIRWFEGGRGRDRDGFYHFLIEP